MQVLLTKISQTCQSIRDMKRTRKGLAFCQTSTTTDDVTSPSNWGGHSTPHSDTSDWGSRDDNVKKSSSSTSSSLGDTCDPDTPTCRDPTCSAPDPHQLPNRHYQMEVSTLLYLAPKESLCLHPKPLSRIPGDTHLMSVGRRPLVPAARSSALLQGT